MGIRYVVNMFRRGSVCVTGQRGCGKDILVANVVARRRSDYVANVDYDCTHSQFHELHYQDLQMGGITYKDLVTGNFKKFSYPYPEGADIYISDIGVYFPSQYCNELNKMFSSVPLFLALSRHIADCNVHLNVQNLNRAWDKFREHSDQYILCKRCFVLFKGRFVIQQIIIYNKAESCQARTLPCRIRAGKGKEGRAIVDTYKDNYYNIHGMVRPMWLFYRNRSNYDTRFFKKMLVLDPDPALQEGVCDEKEAIFH